MPAPRCCPELDCAQRATDDGVIAGATADIAAKCVADICFGRCFNLAQKGRADYRIKADLHLGETTIPYESIGTFSFE